MKKFLCLFAALIPLLAARAADDTVIYDLRTDHATEPLALEHTRPEFSWKMSSTALGRKQEAYRIRVSREIDGREVWDSGIVRDSVSIGIRYLGVGLQAGYAYSWDLEVSDNAGQTHSASSRFEMGLMNPKISAWKGAAWIGDPSPSLDAASLSLFTISSGFTIVKGNTAGFIFGAGDFRLGDIFYNSSNLATNSYFKVLLDFGSAPSDDCEIRIYRVGYAPGDKATEPLIRINRKTYPKLNLASIIGKTGINDDHSLSLTVRDGQICFAVDGKPVTTGSGSEASWFTISPLGPGHEVNTFPHLCSVGFAAEPGSDVTYTAYSITPGGRSETGPVFFGAEQYARFEPLSCVMIPRYRNQSAYEHDVVVINKGATPIVETIDPSYGGAKMLRSSFTVPGGKKLIKAKLYASALGVYSFYINGKRVGTDWFAPGSSQYRERVAYQAYDVTHLIRGGANAMGAELFEGWYSGFSSGDPSDYNFYGDSQALLCRLDLIYEDGSSESLVSSPDSWKVWDGGPVRSGSFFQGERYDARLEKAIKGWSEASYDDSAWKPASPVATRSWVNPSITSRYDEPVRVREIVQATERSYIHSDDYHTFIYNMGVDMVGVPEIIVPAGWLKEGDVVVMRYASRLYPGLNGDTRENIKLYGKKGRNIAGHMVFEDSRSALNTDFYIASGSEGVVIRPRSSWRGYRYIQITIPSHEGPLPLQNVKGLILSSCPSPTGTYEAVAGDDDAPDLSASYNADVYNFFREWMRTLRDDQGVGSFRDAPGSVSSAVPAFATEPETSFPEASAQAAAVCIVPWSMYLQYGDKLIIGENLDAMMNWLNGMAFYPLSDTFPHLSAKAGDATGNEIYIYAMDVTARMAEAVGREDCAALLKERHALAKEEWQRAFPGRPEIDHSAADTPIRLGVFSESDADAAASNSTNSLNRFAPGSVVESLYQHRLGISCGDSPGYKHFILQPIPDGELSSLKGGIESPYGPIESRWTTDEHGRMNSYSTHVPANTSATLYLPISHELESYPEGEWERFLGVGELRGMPVAIYELSSGRHEFLIEEDHITVL